MIKQGYTMLPKWLQPAVFLCFMLSCAAISDQLRSINSVRSMVILRGGEYQRKHVKAVREDSVAMSNEGRSKDAIDSFPFEDSICSATSLILLDNRSGTLEMAYSARQRR